MVRNKIPTEHIPLVQKTIEALASGQYESLDIWSPNENPIQDIKNAIAAYSKAVGKSITLPPSQTYQEPQEVLDTVDEDYQGKRTMFISFPLWFDGWKSDLCAEIELEEQDDGQWTSRLTDVLVP